MTGLAVTEFAEQDLHPNRDPVFAMCDEFGLDTGSKDGLQTTAGAHTLETLAVDHTPVGLDFNLDHAAILRTAQRLQVQAALGALST